MNHNRDDSIYHDLYDYDCQGVHVLFKLKGSDSEKYTLNHKKFSVSLTKSLLFYSTI